MSVSDSSRVQLAYVAESEYGVQETGSNLQILRHTGETLKQDTGIQQSAEIRSDRQVADIARTGIGVSGQVNAEMTYGTYDDLLAAALMSAGWSSEVEETEITYSMSDVDNSINDSASGFVTAGYQASQWVKISGFTESANNGYFKIVSVAAGKMVLSGGTVVTEAAGDSVTVTMGPQIVNGTTKTSFNIEREYQDLSNELSLFLGCMINELGLNVALDSMITGNFGIIGKKEQSLTASGGSGYDAASTTEVMNCVDDILALFENQVAVDSTTFSLSLNNNLRARNKLGELGAFDVGTGIVNVTGSLQAYFQSKTLFDKYLNFTATSLAIKLEDGAGNAYIIDLPNVNFTDGQRQAGGQNQDIIADLQWQAFLDATEGITIRIAKFAA